MAPKTKKKAPAKKSTKAKSSSTKSKAAPKKQQKWQSRAATRLVEPGSSVDCQLCGERVKFQAKMRNQQVICNVYIKNVWSHVEHFHADCYKEAKQPFGKPSAPIKKVSGSRKPAAKK